MKDRENVISDLEEQIAWIRDNDFHKFPGWGHAVLAMRDALALLKEQEPRTALNIVKVHEGTLGNCPTCGAELMSYYNEIHCGRCGQAVKWE